MDRWLRLDAAPGQEPHSEAPKPIEPEGRRFGRIDAIKWAVILALILYSLVIYYRVPFLTRVGRYLVVEHPLERADIIVCLMGEEVARGLTAADLYRKGLARSVFVGREILPDGYRALRDRGVNYPESRDLLLMMLQGLGVPRQACLSSNRFLKSTIDEAYEVSRLVRKRGYHSLIVVTTPHHTRRAWLAFRKALEGYPAKVMMAPARYSKFRADSWWKNRRYLKEVIIEYQKLLYYLVKEL